MQDVGHIVLLLEIHCSATVFLNVLVPSGFKLE